MFEIKEGRTTYKFEGDKWPDGLKKFNGRVPVAPMVVAAANKKPFKLTPLKARVDDDDTVTLERLKANVANSRDAAVQADKYKSMHGRQAGAGYVIEVTDGIRADR